MGGGLPPDNNVTVQSYKIVTLNGSDQTFIDSVVETSQEAMHDDAIARWLVRDSLYRRFWSVMIDPYLMPAESNLNIALEGAESTILARIYPDEEKVSFLGGVLQQFQMMPCFWLTRLRAAASVGDTMDARKAEFSKAHGSFIHVFLVGTRVKHRNKGMGAALLEHINRYADEHRMHCYLEASSEDSRRLYKRHGYADLETWRVRDGAPPFFFMSRAPRSVSHRLVAEE